jgi:hypothetical protein
MALKQSKTSSIKLVVFLAIICISNAFNFVLLSQHRKLSRCSDMKMVSSDNEKPTKKDDAMSRRRKRRGKDEEPDIALPKVSFLYLIFVIKFLSFM